MITILKTLPLLFILVLVYLIVSFIACKIDKIIENNIRNYDKRLMLKASNFVFWLLVCTIIELIILMYKFR